MPAITHYLEVKEKVDQIAARCGREQNEITLVAVSKGHGKEKVNSAYEQGCRDFGESRVQDALEKIEGGLPHIHWHLIGTLQKNKVNKVIGKFTLIHSVDNFELAQKISQSSVEAGILTSILIQVNTSGESSKHGLSGAEWLPHFEKLMELPSLEVKGLMTIAPLVEDEKKIRNCFASLRKWRETFAGMAGKDFTLPDLSMGMSHDYPIAIEEGATILRIGSAIFQ